MQLLTQIIARNTKANVVVLSSDAKGTEFVEWQPAGDPNGGDIQVVPDAVAHSPAFTKLISRGIIEIEEADEEFKAAVERQNAAFERRLSGASAKAAEVMDPEAKNDMLSVPCVGPDGRGQGKCGAKVPVREKTMNDHAPLCSTHAHLAPQYVSEEVQEGTEKKIKWVRVTLGSPERQQV